ncbi:hypothetical protein [Corynebacterium tapiri]|uniref:Histidine-type phosphatase n=1 Tax=Corynebacterium tapiri TaxID=1448266 RepID=A0A5C4U1Q9_9CORY|nr:hypothetical protein [Corynebacterium tapiri]TNL95693.1 hypothetical protein FHE74_08845 [Corynebacterium tapiri]
MSFRSRALLATVVSASLVTSLARPATAADATNQPDLGNLYGSNTPYPAPETAPVLEQAPAGYSPVYVAAFLRHGSRTSSSADHINQMIKVLEKAKSEGTLTPLGEELLSFYRNDMLPAHNKIGGGNLTELGKSEWTAWSQRAQDRLQNLPSGKIAVEASTKARAIDSANVFIGVTQNSPENQHALPAKATPIKEVLQSFDVPNLPSSQERDQYLKTDGLYATVKGYPTNPADALSVMPNVLRPYIGDAADQLSYSGYCGGPARELFETRSIAAGMKTELGDKQFPEPSGAERESFMQGLTMVQRCTAIDEWYKRGAGFGTTSDGAEQTFSYAHGKPVLKHMFDAIDQRENTGQVATVMASHNEVLTPLNAIMAISEIGADATAKKDGELFNYTDFNGFTQAESDPMMGNIEWDVFGNAQGDLIVRMQHNEKPVHFGRNCQVKAGTQNFYDYTELKACLPDVGQGRETARAERYPAMVKQMEDQAEQIKAVSTRLGEAEQALAESDAALDQAQNQNDVLRQQILADQQELVALIETFKKTKAEYDQKVDSNSAEAQKVIDDANATIQAQATTLKEQADKLSDRDAEIKAQAARIKEQADALDSQNATLDDLARQLKEQEEKLAINKAQQTETDNLLETAKKDLEVARSQNNGEVVFGIIGIIIGILGAIFGAGSWLMQQPFVQDLLRR